MWECTWCGNVHDVGMYMMCECGNVHDVWMWECTWCVNVWMCEWTWMNMMWECTWCGNVHWCGNVYMMWECTWNNIGPIWDVAVNTSKMFFLFLLYGRLAFPIRSITHVFTHVFFPSMFDSYHQESRARIFFRRRVWLQPHSSPASQRHVHSMGGASDGPRLLLHRHDGASIAHVVGEFPPCCSPRSFPSLPLLLLDSIFACRLIQKDVSLFPVF